jgi:hypothetical protein
MGVHSIAGETWRRTERRLVVAVISFVSAVFVVVVLVAVLVVVPVGALAMIGAILTVLPVLTVIVLHPILRRERRRGDESGAETKGQSKSGRSKGTHDIHD